MGWQLTPTLQYEAGIPAPPLPICPLHLPLPSTSIQVLHTHLKESTFVTIGSTRRAGNTAGKHVERQHPTLSKDAKPPPPPPAFPAWGSLTPLFL